MRQSIALIALFLLTACEHQEEQVKVEPFFLERSSLTTEASNHENDQLDKLESWSAGYPKPLISRPQVCHVSIYCQDVRERMTEEEFITWVQSGEVTFSYRHSNDIEKNSQIRRAFFKEIEKLYHSKNEFIY